MYTKMLPLNRPSHDLPYDIIYFSVAQIFIEFDNRLILYSTLYFDYIFGNQKQIQISDQQNKEILLRFG